MKSFENDAHGSTKDAFRPRLAGLGLKAAGRGACLIHVSSNRAGPAIGTKASTGSLVAPAASMRRRR